MKNALHIIPRLSLGFSLTIAVFTVGCGGGGGGSAGFSAPPIAITNVNAPKVSAQSYSLGGTVGSPVVGQGGAATPASGGAFGAVPASVGQKVHGLNLATRVMDQFNRLSDSNGRRGILSASVVPAASSVYQCSNQGGTYTINSSSNTSASITFSNCVDTPGETLNGAMSFSSVTGTDPNSPPWAIAGHLGFSNFRIDSDHAYLMNGSSDFEMGSNDNIIESLSISNGNFTVAVDGISNTMSGFNLSMTESNADQSYTLSMNGILSSNQLNGSVTFTTLTQFAGMNAVSNDPESGKMKIVGANNSSVTLTALGSGQVRLEVDADGDGQIDVNGTSTTTWSALDATV